MTVINLDDWANQQKPVQTVKVRKTRGSNKEVKHKIFADCAMVINNTIGDKFWVDKLTLASVNKFPKGFSYNDGLLFYRKGAKNLSIEISSNPYEAAYASIDFLRTHAGLFSAMDQQNSLILQQQRAQETAQNITWGEANKKVQECMLSNYIVEMKNIMNLSPLEMKQLKQTIKLGISGKMLGKHNINVENNNVRSIDGLLWNSNTREFYLSPDLKPINTRSYSRSKKSNNIIIDPANKDTVPQFNFKWNKYLDAMDKKIARNNKRTRRIIDNTSSTHLTLNIIPSSTDVPSTDVDDEDDDYSDEDE